MSAVGLESARWKCHGPVFDRQGLSTGNDCAEIISAIGSRKRKRMAIEVERRGRVELKFGLRLDVGGELYCSAILQRLDCALEILRCGNIRIGFRFWFRRLRRIWRCRGIRRRCAGFRIPCRAHLPICRQKSLSPSFVHGHYICRIVCHVFFSPFKMIYRRTAFPRILKTPYLECPSRNTWPGIPRLNFQRRRISIREIFYRSR